MNLRHLRQALDLPISVDAGEARLVCKKLMDGWPVALLRDQPFHPQGQQSDPRKCTPVVLSYPMCVHFVSWTALVATPGATNFFKDLEKKLNFLA